MTLFKIGRKEEHAGQGLVRRSGRAIRGNPSRVRFLKTAPSIRSQRELMGGQERKGGKKEKGSQS